MVEARQQLRLVDEAAQAEREGLANLSARGVTSVVPSERVASDDGMYSLIATWRCSGWSHAR